MDFIIIFPGIMIFKKLHPSKQLTSDCMVHKK